LFVQYTATTPTPTNTHPFPATPSQVVTYITKLHANGYAPSTITTFVSPISFVNKLYNAPDPSHHFLISKMLDGARKAGHTPDTRQPITLAILHKLVQAIPSAQFDPFQQTLIKSMFLIAFHGFLRVGEITVRSPTAPQVNTIQATNSSITFRNNHPTSATITLVNSKHNKAHPFHITIPANHTHNCPVQALHNYLSRARPTSGALFQFHDGTPVTRHYFQAQLNKCLKAANIDATRVRTHSFRIGAATECVSSLGLPDHEVQRLGRWGSGAFKSYIRSPNFTSFSSH